MNKLTNKYVLNQKLDFKSKLSQFVQTLKTQVSTESSEWTIKGFIDIYKNIYTISADTKIISKILEIHIFPRLFQFASDNNFNIILADHQNYYPDISFVHNQNEKLKFAVDLKTTYRKPDNPDFCNGFTLGSHGEYFTNRTSKKNIQFPYNEYIGHFCLGIIYSRNDIDKLSELSIQPLSNLKSIISVIKDFEFFVCEKWELASDKGGSGNTANIGSINKIDDIISGNGIFKNLGEDVFDDYWMNYGKIIIRDNNGKEKKIRSLKDFLIYRRIDPKKMNLGRIK